MRTFGADISHWEGDVDWTKGVDYLPFVYYKATDGLYGVDSQFIDNKTECQLVGIPNAPYHWWQELQDPVAQAVHFIETAGTGYYKRYIVDVEPKSVVDYNKLLALLNKVESLTGIIPAIYTSAYYWNSFVKRTYPSKYPLIVANYAYAKEPLLPMGATNWIIWQFTDMFWFWGCEATADGNWFNGTLEECRAWFGNYRPYAIIPSEFTKMKVVSDWVYIRSGPGTNYPTIGKLYKGNIINVRDVTGTQAWVKHDTGWTASNYNGYNYLDPA